MILRWTEHCDTRGGGTCLSVPIDTFSHVVQVFAHRHSPRESYTRCKQPRPVQLSKLIMQSFQTAYFPRNANSRATKRGRGRSVEL